MPGIVNTFFREVVFFQCTVHQRSRANLWMRSHLECNTQKKYREEVGQESTEFLVALLMAMPMAADLDPSTIGFLLDSSSSALLLSLSKLRLSACSSSSSFCTDTNNGAWDQQIVFFFFTQQNNDGRGEQHTFCWCCCIFTLLSLNPKWQLAETTKRTPLY